MGLNRSPTSIISVSITGISSCELLDKQGVVDYTSIVGTIQSIGDSDDQNHNPKICRNVPELWPAPDRRLSRPLARTRQGFLPELQRTRSHDQRWPEAQSFLFHHIRRHLRVMQLRGLSLLRTLTTPRRIQPGSRSAKRPPAV